MLDELHIPTSMHQSQWYICSSPTFTVTIVTIAMVKCISAIIAIDRQISLFLFYFSLRVISKLLAKIMPFNNRKLNSVQLYGKYVN